MIDFTCPHCGHHLQIPEEHIGATGTCNHCTGRITVVVAPPRLASLDLAEDTDDHPPVIKKKRTSYSDEYMFQVVEEVTRLFKLQLPPGETRTWVSQKDLRSLVLEATSPGLLAKLREAFPEDELPSLRILRDWCEIYHGMPTEYVENRQWNTIQGEQRAIKRAIRSHVEGQGMCDVTVRLLESFYSEPLDAPSGDFARAKIVAVDSTGRDWQAVMLFRIIETESGVVLGVEAADKRIGT